MRRELFQPTAEGEARVLLLIAAFTSPKKSLEGRTKLAKLDFLLRYPQFFQRAIDIRVGVDSSKSHSFDTEENIETRMIRYRFGPWDPAYFAILGSLIGRGLVDPVPEPNGVGYRATPTGRQLARKIASAEPWSDVAVTARLLSVHFDKSGSWLKDFIYSNFPEVTESMWGQAL